MPLPERLSIAGEPEWLCVPEMDDLESDASRDDVVREMVRRYNAFPALVEACESIAQMNDPDPIEENYRADDPEGCMETSFSVAKRALQAAKGETPDVPR